MGKLHETEIVFTTQFQKERMVSMYSTYVFLSESALTEMVLNQESLEKIEEAKRILEQRKTLLEATKNAKVLT